MGDFGEDDDYYDDEGYVGGLLSPGLRPRLVDLEPRGLLGPSFGELLRLGVVPMGGGGGRALIAPREVRSVYSQYGRPVTAYGTHEMTLGMTSGHLPAISEGGARVRRAYANDPRSWWQIPDGRDILYSAQGVPVGATLPSIGYFRGKFNPGQAATPLVWLTGRPGERTVSDASRRVMTGTEALRAYLDGQDGGGWSVPIHGQKLSHANSYEIDLLPQFRNSKGLSKARSVGRQFGFYDVANYGSKAMVTNFDPARTVALSPEMNRAIAAETRARLNSGAVPVHRDGGLAEYHWPKDIGSGAVTRQLLSNYLGAAQVKLLSSPEARERVLLHFDRDVEVAARRGTPLRQDLQYARRTFARGGIEALDAALRRGRLPVAAIGLFLPYLVDAATERKPGRWNGPRKRRPQPT